MKQKTLYQVMGLALFGAIILVPSQLDSQAYAGGTGAKGDPYLISSVEDLNEFRLDIESSPTMSKSYFLLTQNLDLAGFDTDDDPSNGNWSPIGFYSAGSSKLPFYGTFDGGGHVIKNVEIQAPTVDGVGFFAYLQSGTIQNLGLEQINVVGKNRVGGLVGSIYGGTIENCYVLDSTMNGIDYVGGLAGYSEYSGLIKNTYAFADVTGARYVAGLAGNTMINAKIQNSYAVALNQDPVIPFGVIGFAQNVSLLSNVYWDQEATRQTDGGKGALGLNTDQMIGELASHYLEGFDFDTVWKVTEGYPQLQWEEVEREYVPVYKGEVQDPGNMTINGDIAATVISFTVPTELSFLVNPNAVEGERFVAPEFTVSNDSNSPLTLSVGTFEETTDLFTDVHGDRYQDSEWDKLGVKDSKQFALALNLEEGENWLVQAQLESLYAKTVQDANTDVELGTIRPNSDVAFNFSAKHGLAFKEALNPEYSITFIFDLFNE